MSFKNTTHTFGSISKLFHWLIFVLFTAQLYFIWIFYGLSQDDPTRGNYMFLHKSFGATILILAVLWIIWRWINVHPTPIPNTNNWQNKLARMTHALLLIGLVLLPLSGILMGMAGGRDLNWFGIYILKPFSFMPQNEMIGGALNTAHTVIGYSLIALICLHIVGALLHHFYYKDAVLKRMLPFS